MCITLFNPIRYITFINAKRLEGGNTALSVHSQAIYSHVLSPFGLSSTNGVCKKQMLQQVSQSVSAFILKVMNINPDCEILFRTLFNYDGWLDELMGWMTDSGYFNVNQAERMKENSFFVLVKRLLLTPLKVLLLLTCFSLWKQLLFTHT